MPAVNASNQLGLASVDLFSPASGSAAKAKTTSTRLGSITSARSAHKAEWGVDEVVEQICETGCRSVRKIIDSLEQGLPVELTAHLSEQARQEVCVELKSIMAVYGDQCRI